MSEYCSLKILTYSLKLSWTPEGVAQWLKNSKGQSGLYADPCEFFRFKCGKKNKQLSPKDQLKCAAQRQRVISEEIHMDNN